MINNLNCVFTQYVKTSPKLVVTEFNCDLLYPGYT